MEQFKKEYLDQKEPLHFRRMHITDMSGEGKTFETSIEVHYTDHGIERSFEAVGNGPIDAVKNFAKSKIELLGAKDRV